MVNQIALISPCSKHNFWCASKHFIWGSYSFDAFNFITSINLIEIILKQYHSLRTMAYRWTALIFIFLLSYLPHIYYLYFASFPFLLAKKTHKPCITGTGSLWKRLHGALTGHLTRCTSLKTQHKKAKIIPVSPGYAGSHQETVRKRMICGENGFSGRSTQFSSLLQNALSTNTIISIWPNINIWLIQ